jgi:hypothetical protein
MKIKKLWDGLKNQNVSDSSGKTWSVANLIEYTKDLPVMEIPLDHLCIDKDLGNINLRKFVAHLIHVRDCDLDIPIILDENGSIFDGFHRVAKAILENKETIKAVRFEEDPPWLYSAQS